VVFIRNNSKLFYLFVVLLYIFIVQQTLNNRHSHFYTNGLVVTHSHPTNREEGKPIQDHHHTTNEIYFYHQVNFDYFTHTGVFQITFQVFTCPQDYLLTDDAIHFQYALQHPETRGPPASLHYNG